MTILETFLSFAQALPADRREAMEAELVALMESYSAECDFKAAEIAEIERRRAAERPEFADPADISALFGKPFTT